MVKNRSVLSAKGQNKSLEWQFNNLPLKVVSKFEN